jgi:hypothetical protein
MKTLNIILIVLFIVIVIAYGVLASYTKYNSPNTTLTDGDKKLLYSTTIFGYLLGFILVTIETSYLITELNDIIIFRIIELLIVLILIFIAYYSYIYQEDINQGWGKVSAALWSLMIPLTMVAISCTAGIYLYYTTHATKNKLVRNASIAYLDNQGGLTTSDVFVDTSETYFNKIGGDTIDEKEAHVAEQVRGLIF